MKCRLALEKTFKRVHYILDLVHCTSPPGHFRNNRAQMHNCCHFKSKFDLINFRNLKSRPVNMKRENDRAIVVSNIWKWGVLIFELNCNFCCGPFWRLGSLIFSNWAKCSKPQGNDNMKNYCANAESDPKWSTYY